MPGHSPVVIDSSSPAAFRPPTISPQQSAKKAKSTAQSSSSPGLPSPSTLFGKSSTSGLVAGSRAQQVPEGANKGFASAASLLKPNYFGASVEASKEGARRHAKDGGDHGAEKSAGKLSRPKKLETAEKARPERQRSITPFDDYAYLAPSLASRKASKSPTLASPIVLNPPSDALQRPRAPNISLSEYDFRPGQQSPSEAVLPEGKVAKKARKSKAAFAGGTSDKPARQPKKKAAKVLGEKKSDKSASFILNSDDLASTQFAALEAKDVQGERSEHFGAEGQGDAEHTKAKARPRKASKKAKDKEEPASRLPKTNSKPKGSTTHALEVQHDQQSAFFAHAKTSTNTDLNTFALPTLSPHRSEHGAADLDTLPAPAHRRRLSWTPVKNTSVTAQVRADTARSDTSIDADGPTLRMADVIGNFEYANEDKPQPMKRTHSGEALTKRRRVDLADDATRPPTARKAEAVQPPPPVEPRRKEKAPKKKPQTITDLATKAYRPEDVVPAPVDQPTVSSFFVPNAEAQAAAAEVPAVDGEGTAKVKKPRKPRTKKADDNAAETAKPKNAKAAKAKVRFNEADYLAQLYCPEQARAEERRQDFLFGTSSQLGGEDSPTFIRQMQMAVRESESISGFQDGTSPTRKSCTKVRSQPHATSLSVEQGSKEHWCSAARDHDGETLDASYVRPAFEPQRAASPNKGVTEAACSSLVSPERELQPPAAVLPAISGIVSDHGSTGNIVNAAVEPAHEIVDLSRSSSPAAMNPDLAIGHRRQKSPIQADSGLSESQAAPRKASPPLNAKGDTLKSKAIDSWNALTDLKSVPPWSPPLKAQLPSLKRSATSPIRPALQMLDSNIHSPMHTSPYKTGSIAQYRALTDNASPREGKRPRGRPKKVDAIVESSNPKRRGRPPKQTQAIPDHLSPPAFKSASQPASSPNQLHLRHEYEPILLLHRSELSILFQHHQLFSPQQQN
ncbi:Structure-specific endonuclease subunit SLX4 [Pseudocercospora fuligena]|uniref:Structure-specific endonuclease subunit SLX4 n=1 Tax=Pseudocercospora fuligena TaxID=685502 RepID=A0A8H6RHZ2_9PEZI|nr:Structure-specific endonuclease subunit SLX4 [Pseudocercospora fuligena]